MHSPFRSQTSFYSYKEMLMNAWFSCTTFLPLHLFICPFLISVRHDRRQKVPSPKSCTQMTKIWTHKLRLEKNPPMVFGFLGGKKTHPFTSVLPRSHFSKCIGVLQISLDLRHKYHLVIYGTIPKYFKLSACNFVPFIPSAFISAECFIFPSFPVLPSMPLHRYIKTKQVD